MSPRVDTIDQIIARMLRKPDFQTKFCADKDDGTTEYEKIYASFDADEKDLIDAICADAKLSEFEKALKKTKRTMGVTDW